MTASKRVSREANALRTAVKAGIGRHLSEHKGGAIVVAPDDLAERVTEELVKTLSGLHADIKSVMWCEVELTKRENFGGPSKRIQDREVRLLRGILATLFGREPTGEEINKCLG